MLPVPVATAATPAWHDPGHARHRRVALRPKWAQRVGVTERAVDRRWLSDDPQPCRLNRRRLGSATAPSDRPKLGL
jgi:hypothetical protein